MLPVFRTSRGSETCGELLMARCLIGCGSNQGARREQLDRAIELLGVMPGVALEAVSRHRETRPVGGPPDQSPFLNGACLIETELGPHELLGTLAAVENTLHRDRSERWGPRTIDLDLLLYDDLVLDDVIVEGAALTVPHPRMTTRRFVLEPAVEIAPDLYHPLSGCTLRALLDNISQPHLHVSVVGVPGSGAAAVAAAIADATLARLVAAPAALPWRPRTAGRAADWASSLAASAAPLHAHKWPDDPHGTVADYWLGTWLVAAVDALQGEALDRFTSDYAAITAGAMPPNVAILLQASPATLAERISFRDDCRERQSPVDLSPATDAEADLEALLSLQEKLISRLRCSPENSRAACPPAVILIRADDLIKAADEAIAAVEAIP